MLRIYARAAKETAMATAPTRPDDAPRGDDTSRSDVPPVPDEAGPHDVPDDDVIEHTLPKKGRDE
jgi:hypothetical protein